jgi:hypothetical protein
MRAFRPAFAFYDENAKGRLPRRRPTIAVFWPRAGSGNSRNGTFFEQNGAGLRLVHV